MDNRLPFGAVCSAGKFQEIIDSLLGDMKSVEVHQDDILVTGA
jgi:hypothetical protein